jgi:prepilin-type N-terminal cleavage/methylation domain-containing protein
VSRKTSPAFTLIELVMVIVILGVMAAVALPIFVNLQSEANTASEAGVVGGIRAGLQTYFIDTSKGNRAAFPTTLDAIADATTAAKASPLFTIVLTQGGITANWKKVTASTYSGPTNTVYTYNSTSGSFI